MFQVRALRLCDLFDGIPRQTYCHRAPEGKTHQSECHMNKSIYTGNRIVYLLPTCYDNYICNHILLMYLQLIITMLVSI